MEESTQINNANRTTCPDCESTYPQAAPGTYRCPKCYCKFSVASDLSVNIIPYFDELRLEPFLVMLGVLGVVLLFAMGDKYLAFSDRLKIFLLFFIGVFAIYKLSEFACRRYRGVDRFFRRFSRFGLDQKDDTTLIKL